ncbi:SAM-dependent methyltransferase [Paenibacillus sediminis]|uniref:23S rRNA (Cytidine2498-2'-O)-methyltransferase n=1 Tax=Paenibacillus sediminis TaxID=664909 RepID=A0ABS4H087_9BACL|nr:SAM-dependent methyltransferase [Paenibacillus sediminis]MBP1935906.1 23S rRNA (cytidine2498-2'-O)-methyltransferase [Paenibacillus sediminis]
MDNEQITSNDTREGHSRFICTANHGFAPYAQEELRRLFGAVKSTMLISGEVFLATLNRSAVEAIELISEHPPIFLRHIQPVQFEQAIVSDEGNDSQQQALEAMIAFLLNRKDTYGLRTTVQVRKSGDSPYEGSPAELKQWVQEQLASANMEFALRDADVIISIFVSKDKLFAGVSSPEDNLSDWSGGAIRFQKEEGQISRAKFKLLEVEKTFNIDFTNFRNALDIGAAPGGWTSFLIERGIHVTAVDPAKMHPSLMASPQLTYFKKNAADVKFKENQFDLLVCDMSWSPKLMVKLVTDLLYALVPGGTAIVTVKLLHKKPMAVIREVIQEFEDARMQIQRAKQLFHNRDEITLYMIKY